MLLALPSNHVAPSTLIFALNGFARAASRPSRRTRARPNRSFSPPSASRIICASNPAPAITREPLAVHPADVERAPRAVEPDLAPPPRCPSGSRGWWRAGSPCPRGRSRAWPCRSGERRRCSAAPSRHRPRRRRAPRPPRAPRFTCFGALRLFGTSYQSGSATPWLLELAPKLDQPAAERLARSARRRRRVLIARALCRCVAVGRRRPVTRATKQRRRERGDADQDAGEGVERVVHAAVHPRHADDDGGMASAIAQTSARRTPRSARREQQREPGVERDRRGHVARRKARVDGKLLEPSDVRPLAVDEEHRRPVGRRLEGDDANRRIPATASAAGSPNPIATRRRAPGARTRPESSDPTNDRASSAACAARPATPPGARRRTRGRREGGSHDVNDETQRESWRPRGCVAEDEAEEEDDDGMAHGEPLPQAHRQRATAAVRAPGTRSS